MRFAIPVPIAMSDMEATRAPYGFGGSAVFVLKVSDPESDTTFEAEYETQQDLARAMTEWGRLLSSGTFEELMARVHRVMTLANSVISLSVRGRD
jgi:hypothetical protein